MRPEHEKGSEPSPQRLGSNSIAHAGSRHLQPYVRGGGPPGRLPELRLPRFIRFRLSPHRESPSSAQAFRYLANM